MNFNTKVLHAGVHPDPTTGAIMTPIYQTSTYVQEELGKHKGYEYSRTLNPTRHALENNLASLENGKFGLCFGSGMAACDAVMKLLKPGDEVISSNDLYGGSYRLFTTIFANYGIKFHFVDMTELPKIEEKINGNTKLIWVETPTNPMMNIVDISAISEICKTKNILLTVDNTFATPYLQQPLELGADIVLHSVTKYLGGHSDVVMGALIVRDKELSTRLYHIQNSSGAVTAPMDSFLVLRGIKTLHLRMQRHCENGAKVAAYLKNHPKIDKLYWPGLESHKNHEIAKRQMKDFGGMISFSLKEDALAKGKAVIESFKVFSLAESLGGVESLACHPSTMTHASIPETQRLESGITPSLIRLSVGVEDIEDLLQDIEQAINNA